MSAPVLLSKSLIGFELPVLRPQVRYLHRLPMSVPALLPKNLLRALCPQLKHLHRLPMSVPALLPKNLLRALCPQLKHLHRLPMSVPALLPKNLLRALCPQLKHLHRLPMSVPALLPKNLLRLSWAALLPLKYLLLSLRRPKEKVPVLQLLFQQEYCVRPQKNFVQLSLVPEAETRQKLVPPPVPALFPRLLLLPKLPLFTPVLLNSVASSLKKVLPVPTLWQRPFKPMLLLLGLSLIRLLQLPLRRNVLLVTPKLLLLL
ncbi:hypothetical protein BDR26DRAFT_174341 [Obelidium mucronatum]|nr:hypothetical protein BDR26DRAFT_174341 [Obelidium mucronatum]